MKQRIYKKNKDVLIQLDRLERIDKVEEALGEQQGDYERLLRGMTGREGEGEGAVDGIGERKERGKRKTVVDDEDGDKEEAGGGGGGTEGGEREAKRRKGMEETAA